MGRTVDRMIGGNFLLIRKVFERDLITIFHDVKNPVIGNYTFPVGRATSHMSVLVYFSL